MKKASIFLRFFYFFYFPVDIPWEGGYNGVVICLGGVILADTYSVPLVDIIKEFRLQVAHAASDLALIRITVPDVSRPGLQLAGYFDHFEPMRIQIMGNVELSYLEKLSTVERSIAFDRLFSYKIPALVLARDAQPYPECLAMAQKHNITILRMKEPTSVVLSSLITFMNSAMAPKITRHGVLMEIYGEGILLTGESGIGKSEAAVELLKRGHRLIADDAVEIKRISPKAVVGNAPSLIRNYIELRGIGIVNVARLFGVGAVKEENTINLVVNIVPWNNHQVYDRLGLEDQYMDILGVKVPMYTIPITPGRNLAVILEVAAMNNRQRRMGYNSAKEFTQQINSHFEQNSGL